MAEYGEWNRKGATLSDVTAMKEYGVDREFIIKGLREGKLEYRKGVMWGNPYLRLLRSQLEKYIAEELGQDSLSQEKNKAELQKIKKEITKVQKRLRELEARKMELEKLITREETKRLRGTGKSLALFEGIRKSNFVTGPRSFTFCCLKSKASPYRRTTGQCHGTRRSICSAPVPRVSWN